MRDDRERLVDMLEAIGKIERYSMRSRDDFNKDEMLQVWIVRHLQVIGEAASRVTGETRERFPEIPWNKMIGMRHVLAHGYFDIDLDIVWSVLINDLEPLKQNVQLALQTLA